MKFCMEHWTKLKAAIDVRGLTKFVARDGEEAAKRFIDENETPAKNFDPLMEAHNAILSNAMNCAGLSILVDNEDGTDRCPLCFLKSACTCGEPECGPRFEAWIEKAADEQLDHAKALNLLGSA